MINKICYSITNCTQTYSKTRSVLKENNCLLFMLAISMIWACAEKVYINSNCPGNGGNDTTKENKNKNKEEFREVLRVVKALRCSVILWGI